MNNKGKEAKKAPTKGYKLLRDYKTTKKHYKAGETIQATEKGARYLRKNKFIK